MYERAAFLPRAASLLARLRSCCSAVGGVFIGTEVVGPLSIAGDGVELYDDAAVGEFTAMCSSSPRAPSSSPGEEEEASLNPKLMLSDDAVVVRDSGVVPSSEWVVSCECECSKL